MSSPVLVDCPNCGKPTLKRQMAGGAGMIFKGSGFYLTDYTKSGGEKKASPATPKADAAKDTTPPPAKPSTDASTPTQKKD